MNESPISKKTWAAIVLVGALAVTASAASLISLKRSGQLTAMESDAAFRISRLPKTTDLECDVYWRGGFGDGRVDKMDVDLVSKFSVGTETAKAGIEFQKADCAPRNTKGDGRIDVADWVQAQRYAEGADMLQSVGGPTEPISASSDLSLECDVAPKGGDGRITEEDWRQIGQYSVGNEMPANGAEFQKADCAPASTGGDGVINTTDWVQSGRYWQGYDAPVPPSGPTQPK